MLKSGGGGASQSAGPQSGNVKSLQAKVKSLETMVQSIEKERS
jgi:hypothetical protein